ncbi:DNA N-6-adenine-methyltransferase [Nocardia asteroides]|uniref:DNA N-6-adenine-methyltransferase n=1 Tax=Nocardia asteroides TaxID=1824 RepID=UPI0037C710E0
MQRAIGSHQSACMKSDTWLTPPQILDALGPFDLDPCAAPPPRPWSTASHHISAPDDGLTQPWAGRVWLNPPYSRQAVTWLARLAEHGSGTALVFARTETRWFVDTVWSQASAMLFLHGRLHFHHRDGTRAAANAGAPSVLVAYGAADAAVLASAPLAGTFVDLTVSETTDGCATTLRRLPQGLRPACAPSAQSGLRHEPGVRTNSSVAAGSLSQLDRQRE